MKRLALAIVAAFVIGRLSNRGRIAAAEAKVAKLKAAAIDRLHVLGKAPTDPWRDHDSLN